jgi:hypothetical protein
MQATPVPCRALATLGLAAVLGLSGCQDMNTFMTGEQFPKVQEDFPRIEVELVVDVDPAVWGDLVEHGELEARIVEQVQSVADLGMRFYPALSSEYAEGDARPEHVLTVRVTELSVATDHRLVEKKDQPSRIESKVKSIHSAATAVVARRRDGGPNLVVANGEGKGHVNAVSQERVGELEAEGQPVFGVVEEDPEHEDLRVAESDVLQAVDEAVVDALRGVIKGVDRELGMDAPAKP